MILSEQIISLIFSFVWGFIYYFLFTIFKKYLVFSKYKVLFNIIFNFILAILFFIGIVVINNGILSFYYLIFIVFGFFVSKISLGK